MQRIPEIHEKQIPDSHQTYLLEIEVSSPRTIHVGRLKTKTFSTGTYLYVGSGKHNISSRVQRHLRSEKQNHWHIDYLLNYGTVVRVYLLSIEECNLAEALFDSEQDLEPVDGFGSSDCRCRGHLVELPPCSPLDWVGEKFSDVLFYETASAGA